MAAAIQQGVSVNDPVESLQILQVSGTTNDRHDGDLPYMLRSVDPTGMADWTGISS